MANSGQIIRIEKCMRQRVSIPDCLSVSSLEEDYGSTESEDMSSSPDTSCRSSADADKSFDLDEDFREKLPKYEDIIKKIENLQVRDNDKVNEYAYENGRTRLTSSENVDNIQYRDSCKLQMGRHTDNEDINNNEDNVTVDDNEGCLPLNICDDPRDKKLCHSSYDGNSLDNDSEAEQMGRQEHEDSDEDSDLIQRGPIKPDFQPFRSHPYPIMNLDYDQTAQQILRNKDYSEKLNPCLDQLSDSTQASIGAIGLAMDPNWTGENGNNIFRSGDPSNDVNFVLLSFGH